MTIPDKNASFDDICSWALNEPPNVKSCNIETRDNFSRMGLQAGYDWLKNNKPDSIDRKTKAAFRQHVRQELENSQPKGFILGEIILMAIISSIVGWVCRKLLDKWFSQDL